MGILQVSHDGARAVPREGLDAPDVDPRGPEELGTPAPEGVPTPSPRPGGGVEGQRQLSGSGDYGRNRRCFRDHGSRSRGEKGCCGRSWQRSAHQLDLQEHCARGAQCRRQHRRAAR
eukprot:11223328-Alexandrium_andersonii.AAC.1